MYFLSLLAVHELHGRRMGIPQAIIKAAFTLTIKMLTNKHYLGGNKSEFIQTAPFSLAFEINPIL